MRVLRAALLGLAIAVLVVGLTLVPLTRPLFTRVLAQRFSLSREAGLSQTRMLEVAEQVRGFVADPGAATLPETVDDRPGFDAAAVSHLADVRRVIAGAQVVTWVLAVLLGGWIGVGIARRSLGGLAAAMRAAAAWCVALVLLGVLGGVLDFEALFSAFHGLFFAVGTWQFAYDSLLIQAFPEPFWATAAAVWAGLILVSATALWLAAGVLERQQGGPARSIRQGDSTNGA